MAIVGDAYVVVRAITNRVADDIKRAFDDARPTIRASGESMGDDFQEGFADSIAGGNLRRILSDSLSGVGIDIGDRLNADIADGMRSRINQTGASLGTELAAAIGSGAGGGGRRLADNLFGPGFSSQAAAASQSLTKLIASGNLLGPAIAGAVGAISSVVSGLFAMSAAAASAASSLVVLPGLLGALIQAGGVLKLAFSGVGAAIGSGFKQATTSGGAATSAARSNARAIENAQRALADAYEQAAERMVAAQERVRDAEGNLADAQQDALDAQLALNRAREQAAEDLQQLGFAAEDAALGEERAALTLEKAYDKLRSVQDLPADNRTRREAELAFKEAELNYRQAKDRNSDLKKEQDAAAKAGVEGSERVVDAKRDVQDSLEAVIKAEEELAKARANVDKTARDNAEAIADAQRALADATRAAAEAQGAGTAAANAYNQALKKLSPQARQFVKYIISLRPAFDKLKAAAGEKLFPALEQAIRPIVSNLFPVLIPLLRETGGALGAIAVQISGVVTSARGLTNIQSIGETNIQVTRELGGALSGLVDSMLSILSAAGPLLLRFSQWASSLTQGWAATLAAKNATGELTDFFNKSGDTAAKLGSIFGNLFSAIFNLGKAAGPAGQSLLDSFDQATEKLNQLIVDASKSGELGTFFEGAADNLRSIGNLLNDVGLAFLRVGDNPAIGKAAEALRPAIPILETIGDSLIEAAPQLSEFATAFTDLLKNLTQSGQIQAFIKTLTLITKTLNVVFGNDIVQKILGFAGPIFAVARAFAFVGIIAGFFGKAIAGSILSVGKIFGGFIDMPRRIMLAWSVLSKGGGFGKALSMLTKSSKESRKELQTQMGVDKAKMKTLGTVDDAAQKAAGGLDTYGSAAGKAGKGAAAAPVAAGAAAVGAPLGKTAKGLNVVTKAASGFGKAMGAVGKGLFAALGPIGLIMLAIQVLIPLIMKLWNENETFREVVTKAFKAVADAVKAMWSFIEPILKAIWSFIAEKLIPIIKTYLTVYITVWKAIATFTVEVIKTIVKILAGIIDFFVTLGQKIWGYVTAAFSFVKMIISKEIEGIKIVLGTIISFVSGLVSRVVAIGKGIWNFLSEGIGAAISTVKGAINGVIDFIRGLPGKIAQAAKGMWDGIKNSFKEVINTVIRWWNDFEVELRIPDNAATRFLRLADKGFTLSTPNIPLLAQGGTILPSTSGTLALIGEAGRRERVEPLDSSGLSKRDRAIIGMLATQSGAAGGTINVFPSQGMSEIEVAEMVSRRQAFARRRGA